MSIKRNSALAFAPQALSIGTGIVMSVVTARILGPDGRGVLSLVLLSLAMLALIADFGLGAAVTYFVSKGRLQAPNAVAFCLYGAIIPAAAVGGAALVLWPLVSENVLRGVAAPTFAISLLALPAMLFVNLRTRMEMALHRFSTTMLFQSLQTLALLAATVAVLVIAQLGVEAVVVATVVVWILSALAMGLDSTRAHGFGPRIPLDTIREIRSYAVRAYAGGLVHYSTLRLDSFILNAYAGNAAVGQYSMAVTLTEKLWLIDSSVGQATMPEVISRERTRAADLVAATCRTITLVASVIGGALAILAPWIIGFLYGDAFLPAVTPLRILVPGVILFSASNILSQYYSGQLGRPGVTSAVSVAVAVVSLGLYFLLIPPYGYTGAAIASSIAYALGFTIHALLFRGATGISVHAVIVPTRSEFLRVVGFVRAILAPLSKSRT